MPKESFRMFQAINELYEADEGAVGTKAYDFLCDLAHRSSHMTALSEKVVNDKGLRKKLRSWLEKAICCVQTRHQFVALESDGHGVYWIKGLQPQIAEAQPLCAQPSPKSVKRAKIMHDAEDQLSERTRLEGLLLAEQTVVARAEANIRLIQHELDALNVGSACPIVRTCGTPGCTLLDGHLGPCSCHERLGRRSAPGAVACLEARTAGLGVAASLDSQEAGAGSRPGLGSKLGFSLPLASEAGGSGAVAACSVTTESSAVVSRSPSALRPIRLCAGGPAVEGNRQIRLGRAYQVDHLPEPELVMSLPRFTHRGLEADELKFLKGNAHRSCVVVSHLVRGQYVEWVRDAA